MPLTKKGNKIMAAMKAKYGEKKGEEVFYASKNAGTISGVDTVRAHKDSAGHLHVVITGRQMGKLLASKDLAGAMRTVARGTKTISLRRKDMAPGEMNQLRALMSKFLEEESEEPEHNHDCKGTDACDCGCKH